MTIPIAVFGNTDTSEAELQSEVERVEQKTFEYLQSAEAAEDYFFQKYHHAEFQEYKAELMEASDRLTAQIPLVANPVQIALLKRAAFHFYGLCMFYADMQNELGRFIADKDPFVKKGELTQVRFWIKYRLPFYKTLQEWVTLKIDFFNRALDGFAEAIGSLENETRQNSDAPAKDHLNS